MEYLNNPQIAATLIMGAVLAVLGLAAIILLLTRKTSGDFSALEVKIDDLTARLSTLDHDYKTQNGAITAMAAAQSTNAGELTRTLNERLDQGIKTIQAAVQAMDKSAEAGREALRELVEQKLDVSTTKHSEAATALRNELTRNFTETSNLITQTMRQMGADQQARLNEFSARIVELTKQQGEGQEKLRLTLESQLDKLRQENSVKLDEMRQTVDEKLQSTLEKRLGESFKTVSEQLKHVHEGLGEMQNLATGVGDLKRVLTNVKTRGTWAEIQLGMLLEDYLAAEQFVVNATMKPGSTERVEFAIRFPARDGDDTDIFLPIDSKFPREDYERLVVASEAGDIAAVEAAAQALENSIRNSAKTISEKYINPPHTTDFGILFLPTEGLFAEVLRRPGFLEKLQREYRVTVAGPTTLSSLLSAFQMGFRSLAIQQRSGEVWKILGAVRTEFGKHGQVLKRLKDQLNAASNSVDALGTRTRAMNKQLRDVEALPTGGTPDLLELVTPDDEDSD